MYPKCGFSPWLIKVFRTRVYMKASVAVGQVSRWCKAKMDGASVWWESLDGGRNARLKLTRINLNSINVKLYILGENIRTNIGIMGSIMVGIPALWIRRRGERLAQRMEGGARGCPGRGCRGLAHLRAIPFCFPLLETVAKNDLEVGSTLWYQVLTVNLVVWLLKCQSVFRSWNKSQSLSE